MNVLGSIKVNNAVGIVGFSLLRYPAVAAPDGADLRLADRCHSLASLYLPPAALGSLPLRHVILLIKKALFGEPFLFYECLGFHQGEQCLRHCGKSYRNDMLFG
jgi:hypothetical protein